MLLRYSHVITALAAKWSGAKSKNKRQEGTKDGETGDVMKDLGEMSLEELWQLFPIVLKAYNPDYALWYEEERRRLFEVLCGVCMCRISHVGSTAVAGLISKPIVDILLELPHNYATEDVMVRLQKAGWLLMNRNDDTKTVDFNKGYTPVGFAEKVYHLHVKPSGDWGELYFRDYLIAHRDIARKYEALKLHLKDCYEYDRDAYTNAKTAFVTAYTQKAREEFGGRYRP